jgi:L-amino acid N-acyltransferase YncA
MIRPVRTSDAEAICRVYNHYVLHTIVSFEEEGRLIGYAYATPWKTRRGYRYAVESSIYLEAPAGGKGYGSRLYGELLAELRRRPLHTAIGGIALPNGASVGLHEKLGFRKVAHFQQVGWKCGRWVDVGYWQLNA